MRCIQSDKLGMCWTSPSRSQPNTNQQCRLFKRAGLRTRWSIIGRLSYFAEGIQSKECRCCLNWRLHSRKSQTGTLSDSNYEHTQRHKPNIIVYYFVDYNLEITHKCFKNLNNRYCIIPKYKWCHLIILHIQMSTLNINFMYINFKNLNVFI